MSWEQLQAIAAERSQLREQEASTPPVACPRDGNPLEGAPDGGLFCRACGWRPDELTGELRS